MAARRDGRREKTRERLIRAAFEVVAQEGFESASVDAIARRAGYSVGAIYSNFDGKDDLFFAVFDEHVAWFERQLEAAAAAGDPAQAFAAGLGRISEDAKQFRVFIEFWAYAVRRGQTRRQLAARLALIRARVGALLGGDNAALLALATMRGLALEKLADAKSVPDAVLAEFAGETFT